MQREYRVIWEIDIRAETPEQAARQALAYMRDPDGMATVFKVVDDDGEIELVDLEVG